MDLIAIAVPFFLLILLKVVGAPALLQYLWVGVNCVEMLTQTINGFGDLYFRFLQQSVDRF